ncbi:YeeE/YedE thiosulfate transporter family protein [Uliginosibacterium sp. H3]|uniref:YeeE/YedE thiosulfate transporter family protein n=1 Tax=Uliginosibacterium silvisoli TaxID=3114758 RepID=A0ABU6K8B5_9RHOO|nr:YeeE/YedE thiosulfate transporter family protein [Uliginosibacterium sp. H3]
MQVSNFTPYSALIGGLLIGSAASVLLWLTGRIAGVSGVVSRLLPWSASEGAWRLAFLFGLVAGAAAYYAFWGGAPLARATFPGWLLALGGLLVGFGTSLAGGCTSGHGVCGLGRLSLRSLVATLVFLGIGIVTVFVVRHLAGIQ